MASLTYKSRRVWDIINLQSAFEEFCKKISIVDSTVFYVGMQVDRILDGMSVQVHDESGNVQIQSIHEVTRIERPTHSPYGGGYNNFGNFSFDNEETNVVKDKYSMVATFDKRGTIVSLQITDGNANKIFGIYIGERKFLISGQWFDREGFAERAFQSSVSEPTEAFDIGFVGTVLRDVGILEEK